MLTSFFTSLQPDLLKKITNEEHINSFASMLNKSSDNKTNSKTNRLLKLIYESVVQETIDFVGIILQIENEATNSAPTPNFLQQMKLIQAFYKCIGSETKHILTHEFLHTIMNTIEAKFRAHLKSLSLLLSSSF